MINTPNRTNKTGSTAHPTNPMCSLSIVALLLLSLGGTANAGDTARQYHIPAQSLNNALLQFAADAKLELIIKADDLRGFKAGGLDGNLTPAQALTQLLKDSGMTFRFVDASTVTVESAPSSFKKTANMEEKPKTQSNNGDTGSVTALDKVNVEADNEYDSEYYADPYNKDYVIPNATSGTKTDTPIMETPLNVQVISKQVLKNQQVISLDQALRNVSGVTVTKPGSEVNSQVFLRGFATYASFRNGVRLDIDGSNGFGNRGQFANVESVEVLKGPAAILYRRVEPGGMVNVTTKQPLTTPYYSLNQQFGSYDLYRTSIDATGPLTKDDTLLYRVNASFQSNNSFRDLVKSEDVFFAPIVKWNINPRTQATLEMEYQHALFSDDFPTLPFDSANNRLIDNIPHNRNLTGPNLVKKDNIFVGLNWSHQFNDD